MGFAVNKVNVHDGIDSGAAVWIDQFAAKQAWRHCG
jgi:hypothetical protein